MAKNIKGITIEIGGNTTQLEKALKDVNKIVYSTNSELKSLNQALKLDPKNTELLAQKQEVLKKNIEATKERLETLKEAQRQMGDYNSLTDEQKENYRALSVEIAKSENALKNLEKEYKSFGSVAIQQLKVVGQQLQDFGSKMTSVGKTLSKDLTAPIAGVMALGVKYNAQMEKYQVALTTITKDTKETAKIMEQIKQDAAKTPFDVSGLTQANQLLLSTGLSANETRDVILALGDAVAATGGGDDELQRMAYNLQQVKNLGKATSMDIKQFAMAGIDIYGILADYLGITKEEASQMAITWDDLNGALIAASQEGGRYYNAMNNQSETFNGKISNLKDSLGVLTGELAVALMPILDKLLSIITSLIEKFNNLDPKTQKIVSTVLLIVAAIGPLVVILGTLIGSIGTIITAVTAAIPVITAIVAAISWPVVAIGALIAVIVLLYTKCEWFRNAVNAIVSFIWEQIKSKIELIINIIKTIINFMKTIISTVSSIVSSIVSIFTGLYNKAKNFITKIKDAFVSKIKNINWKTLGSDIVKGIINGFVNIGSYLTSKVNEVKDKVISKFKSVFGIHSPSLLMKKEIGTQISAGIGEGIKDGIPNALKDVDIAMKQLNAGIEASVNPTINPSMSYDTNYNMMAMAMREALQDMDVVLDDNKVGKFVVKTVTDEIYT